MSDLEANVIVPGGPSFNFIIVAIVVAALYFAREILVPIALAVLLSFVLAPPVKFLQRWRLPRSVAVVLAVQRLVYGIHSGNSSEGDQVRPVREELPMRS